MSSTGVHSERRLSTGASTRNRAEFTRLAPWLLTGSLREDGLMLDLIDPRHTPPAGQRRVVGRAPRPLRRRASAEADDRSLLERTGWRTTLDYRENHRRDLDGVLTEVDPRWRGDAERSGPNGNVIVFSAVGPTPSAVWRRLRMEAEAMGLDVSAQGADQHVREIPGDQRQFSRERLARAE